MHIEGEPVAVVTPYGGEIDDDDGRPVIATPCARPEEGGEGGPGERISRCVGYDLHRMADFNNPPRGAPQVPHHSTPRLAKMASYSRQGRPCCM